MVFSSFIADPAKTSYDGADQDENVKYVLRRSNLTNISWLLTTVIMAMAPTVLIPYIGTIKIDNEAVFKGNSLVIATLFWYLITFGFFFQKLLSWFFNVLVVTNKKIVDMDFIGLAYKNVSETMLYNIEDITSNITGIVGTIFNIGDVFIQTAAEKREFEFIGADDPSKVRDLIIDLVEKIKAHDVNN
jgi:hypothetical protein